MKKLLWFGLCTGILTASLACSKVPLPGDSDLESPTDSSATAPPDTVPEKSFYLGVNGHPINQEAYQLSADKQINLIKSLGMSIYRVDVPIGRQGMISLHNKYVALKEAADSAGVTILPMLPPVTLTYKETEEASFQSGYERGRAFASVYGNDFVYYNIANELDNQCILPTKSGTSASHYDPVKFKIIAAHLKGMDEGIKSVDKDAKTMVNACWLHYQYLLMLETYGVNFDIVAYHWYDEMEKLAAESYGITDITQVLSEKFSKPIWFTEINIRNKTGSVSEEVQRDFLNNFLIKCQKNPQVKAAIIYELFNQPVFQSLESHYGLFTWTKRYSEYTPKLWALEQSKMIQNRN